MADNKMKKWKPLLQLAPAVITGTLICTTLPYTKPVLSELPERLTAAAAEEVDGAEINEQEVEEDTEITEALQAVGDYEDGVYTGSAQGYGGQVTVQVTVENRQIISVEILSADGETAAFFNKAKAVIDRVLLSQTWEVDTVSGATYSSRGILGAIQNALTGEKVVNESAAKQSTPVKETVDYEEPAAGYTDGTYYGSAQGFGGQIKVMVVIKDGKISSIDVVNASGETSSFFSRAKGLIPSIISSQSPNVDTVSGATYSSRGIINAVKRALNQAAADSSLKEEVEEDSESNENGSDTDSGKNNTENNSQVEIPSAEDITTEPDALYKDGTYEGTAEGFGGDITVRVTVSGGKIADIQVVSAEDETKVFFNKAKAVIPAMVEAQSADVDTVSGATYSSTGLINAAKEALKQAEVTVTPSEEENPDSKKQDSGTPDTEENESETPDTGKTDPAGSDDEKTEDQQPGENGSETGDSDEKDTGDDSKKPSGDIAPEQDALYKDGTYEGTAEGFGGDITVQVTVSGGKITDIQVVSAEDETKVFFNEAKAVIPAMVEAQSADVDIVSGATYSSTGLINAAKEALKKAEIAVTPSEEENPDSKKQDSGTPDTEENDSETPDTEEKDSETPDTEEKDPETPDAGKTDSDGSDTEKTDDENQSDDAGSGSGSSNPEEPDDKENSENDESDNNTGKLYTDGVYQVCVKVEPDEDESFEEYEIIVNVTISGDQVTDISFDDANTYGGSRVNSRFSAQALNGKSGSIGMAEQITSQMNSEDMDAVSGATCTSNALLQALYKAKNNAVITGESSDQGQDPEENPSEDASSEKGSEGSESTEQPEGSEEIESTEQPEDSEEIESTEQPEDSEGSESTEQPEDSEEIESTEQPEDSEEIESTEQPEDSEGSESTEQPEDSGESESTEQPEDRKNTGVLFEDGTYLIQTTVYPDEDEDFYSYFVYVNVTLLGDRVTAVSFDSSNTYDYDSSNSFYSNKAMNGTKKLIGMAAKIVDAEDPLQVDAVSGATCTSNAILRAVEEAEKEAAELLIKEDQEK